jgi:hypothetical protein
MPCSCSTAAATMFGSHDWEPMQHQQPTVGSMGEPHQSSYRPHRTRVLSALSSLAALYLTMVVVSTPCIVITVIEATRARTTPTTVVLFRKHRALEHREHYMRDRWTSPRPSTWHKNSAAMATTPSWAMPSRSSAPTKSPTPPWEKGISRCRCPRGPREDVSVGERSSEQQRSRGPAGRRSTEHRVRAVTMA